LAVPRDERLDADGRRVATRASTRPFRRRGATMPADFQLTN